MKRKGKRVLHDMREKTSKVLTWKKTKKKLYIYIYIKEKGIESNQREQVKKEKTDLSNP